MSRRGLVAALLCGLIGLGGGLLLGWLVQPRSAAGGLAEPVPGVSPSLPVDVPSASPYAQDIGYPPLSPDLSLPVRHSLRNDLAVWGYHVPFGWQAYYVCSTPCPPGVVDDDPMPPRQIDRASEVRFRPAGERPVGGYSLRVRILDNTFTDVHQTVATKVVGFRDSPGIAEFHIDHRSRSSVYFDYRDAGTNLHRFNYFQWFAVPGRTNATLEMSVSGRERDVPGLKALFNRFADNVAGRVPRQPSPPSSPSAPSSPSSSPSSGPSSAGPSASTPSASPTG
jgi:hypothetical protein